MTMTTYVIIPAKLSEAAEELWSAIQGWGVERELSIGVEYAFDSSADANKAAAILRTTFPKKRVIVTPLQWNGEGWEGEGKQ